MRDERQLQAAGDDPAVAGLRAARVSVSAVFLVHGILVANWLSRIPAVQKSLELPAGILGLTLLSAAAGALVAMPAAAALVGRFGSARVTRATTWLLCAALPLPGLAWNAAALGLCLFVYGAAAGSMDVAMNTQAVDVEAGYGRPVMVGFHAMFSFGGMAGSLIGGFFAGRDVAPAWHLAIAGAAMAAAGWFATRRLAPDRIDVVEVEQSARELLLPLLGLGVVAFCILVGEGAMADWSAVYLSRLTGPGLAPLGYAVFSLAMASGRLAGDWLHERLGSVSTVRWGSGLAAAALAIALAVGTAPAALVGFACVGAGFSAIFPIVCSVAGRRAGNRPQAGIAAVSLTGYFGFLVGPPVIGFLAQAFSLRLALGFVAALSAVTAALAAIVRTRAELE
jgi:MFS family permease